MADMAKHKDFVLFIASELAESVRTQDRECEKRVQFFLALASGTVAVLAIAGKDGSLTYEAIRPALEIALLILLLFGLATLHRLNWRVVYRNQNQPINTLLRNHLKTDSPFFREYYQIRDAVEEQTNQASCWVRTARGSLAEFMYIANGLIGASLFFVACESQWKWDTCIVLGSIASFFLIGGALFIYCRWMRSAMPANWIVPSSKASKNGRGR